MNILNLFQFFTPQIKSAIVELLKQLRNYIDQHEEDWAETVTDWLYSKTKESFGELANSELFQIFLVVLTNFITHIDDAVGVIEKTIADLEG